MLFAEPTAILFGSREDRVPAARWVRALAVSTVRSAGLPHADDDVGAVASVASAWTASVFGTEALAFGGGGAACHRARLLLSTTMFETMLGSCVCVCGASFGCARSVSTMLGTEAPCVCKSVAVFHFAHFCAATAVPNTPSFALCGSLAIAKRAEPICTMLHANPSSNNFAGTVWSRAQQHFNVVRAAHPPSILVGIFGAPPRAADPVGAVHGADKLARNSRGVAGWDCLAEATCTPVLPAIPASPYCICAAIDCFTRAVCAVFLAHASCVCVGGAAIDRARRL